MDGGTVVGTPPAPEFVMSVAGPVTLDELGVTLTHEHLLLDLFKGNRNPDSVLIDRDLAIEEVGRFAAAGGRTIVELTNNGMGRDVEGLREISEATGVNIVVGAGWYRGPYLDESLARFSTNDVADRIVEELTVGVDGTTHRAGVIGEVGTDADYINPLEERVFRASARAHLQTGVTISTHALRSTVGLQQLDLLEEEGVRPNRIVIGHCDSWPDASYHEALAARGVWVQFDRNSGKVEYENRRRLEWVLRLVGRGYADRILLSGDNCFKSDLVAYGGTGYAYVITTFARQLREAGLPDEQVRQLVVDNPMRALSGFDR